MRLFQVSSNQVNIVKDEQYYATTVENYLLDGGVVEIDGKKMTIAVHDSQQGYCEVNGVVLPYPNEFFENIIDGIDALLAKKAEREYVEPTFEELKTAKLAEIKNRYVETVYAPVWFKQTMVDPNGGEATSRYVGYDTDQNSQIDFNSSYKRAQLKGSTLYNIYVNPDDLTEKEFTYHTPEMFDAALLAAGDYQEDVYIKYYGLKAKVEAAETAEELEAIVW